MVEKINVIMTKSAARLVSPETLHAYSGQPVFVGDICSNSNYHIPHIQLPREADAYDIMPATANLIAKAAYGIADDLLSTAIIACPGPVVIVPCMNEQMWFNKAVQRNVRLARDCGYHIMDPIMGIEIADLSSSYGAMPPLEQIIGVISDLLNRRA